MIRTIRISFRLSAESEDAGIPTTPAAEPAIEPSATLDTHDSLATPPAEPAEPLDPADEASAQADPSVLPSDLTPEPQDMGAPGIAQEAGSSSMKSEGNSSAGLIAGIAAGGE